MLGPAVLVVGIVSLFSRKNIALIELITPLFALLVDIMLLVVNSTSICGDVTNEMR